MGVDKSAIICYTLIMEGSSGADRLEPQKMEKEINTMRTFEDIIYEGLTEDNMETLTAELELLKKKQAELEEASAKALADSYQRRRQAIKMDIEFDDYSISGADIGKAYDEAYDLKETHKELEKMLEETDKTIYRAKQILAENRV